MEFSTGTHICTYIQTCDVWSFFLDKLYGETGAFHYLADFSNIETDVCARSKFFILINKIIKKLNSHERRLSEPGKKERLFSHGLKGKYVPPGVRWWDNRSGSKHLLSKPHQKERRGGGEESESGSGKLFVFIFFFSLAENTSLRSFCTETGVRNGMFSPPWKSRRS